MSSFSVLHIDSGSNWGGGQNQVRLLMRELNRLGIRQLCVCPLHSMLAERLQAAKLPVEPVKWLTGSDPRAFVRIARAIRRFDIVHCHDAHALQQAIIPAKVARVPIVAARRVPFRARAFKWNRAERVIAISATVRAGLLRSGVDPQRIRVVFSGTDTEESRAVPRLRPPARIRVGIPENHFVVGNAAAFFAWKKQILIPEAAALLPDVQWLIAGEGPMRGALEAAIAKYGVADRVHLLGWLEDARSLLKELDAYISLASDEALGNSVLEAIALRVPVIAAERGGPAEVIRPVQAETQAVFFDSGDARALADAITRVRDPATRRRIIELQDARLTDFRIERTVEGTLEVYDEILPR